MSILHSFPVIKKAVGVKTHEQRVHLIAELPVDAVEKFLAERAKESPSAGWMNTLTDVGMLDVSVILDKSVNGTMTQELKDEWIRLAHFFMDFAGEPKGKLSKELSGSDSARRHTVFEATDEIRDAFHRATERLIPQIAGLKQHGIALPALDSQAALSNKMLGVLSRWAGTACMLDRADTLKLLVDACPAALSCSMSVATRTLKVAQGNKDTDFDQTARNEFCRVAPFYCALQVGSTACMDVILDKRASLDLTLDVPFSAVVQNSDRSNMGMARGSPFTSAMFRTDPVCSPAAFAHAIGRIQPTLDEKEQNFLASKMISYADKHPHHFVAVAGQGFFHENDDDPNHKVLRWRALNKAVMEAQAALPAFLKHVPWDYLRQQDSPFIQAAHNCKDLQRAPREEALLTLIQQAKIDGQEDKVLAIDAMMIRTKKSQEPVTTLSVNGFNKVMLKFLENGFRPDAKHPDVELTLNQIADADNHPTRNMLRSYLARTKAHKLIDEIDLDGTPAKAAP